MKFDNVVLTQDWHPKGHASFASTFNTEVYSTRELKYGKQVLWPDHCVQGSPGADLHPQLFLPKAQLILRKGYHPDVDSYSAFLEADGGDTGLAAYLKARSITRVYLVGLATDFCVAHSAMDARKFGFDVVVLEDACRGVNLNGSVEAAWKQMKAAGVVRAMSNSL